MSIVNQHYVNSCHPAEVASLDPYIKSGATATGVKPLATVPRVWLADSWWLINAILHL